MSGAWEARAWIRTIEPDRLALVRAMERVEPRRHLPLLLFPILWAVAGLVAVKADAWWIRVPAIILIGFVIHAIGIVMHEAVHGNLFRRRMPDRLAAFVGGLPALVSGAAYRVTHLAHHRHNRDALDPDEFANLFRDRWLQSIAFWVWAGLGLPIFIVHVATTALRRATPRQRPAIITEYALILGFQALLWIPLLRSGHGSILVRVWLLPLFVTWGIVSLRGWSEHMLTRPDHPLTRTRTITSNRVVSFLMLNLNYHLEHHLFPAVPWYNMPALHRLLVADFRAAGASIYRSYLRFAWDAARLGIHGLAPDTARRDA